MFSTVEILWILKWWFSILIIGTVFLPLTFFIFSAFLDKGYLFSKVLALGIISYLILVLNILHVLPFGFPSLVPIIWVLILINLYVFKKLLPKQKIPVKLFVFEETLFIIGIFLWSFIRAHEPSINGLEKFMDFGFVNSILRTHFQPAVDMWFPPLPINYYYFGHLNTAVLTELSNIPSYVTYNLTIATLFSFTFCLSFSLGINLLPFKKPLAKLYLSGLLTGALTALAGNIHTLYAFFKPYDVNNPVPFWKLVFSPSSFPNDYWYPNATRFIPFTIHEFPIYSFVVSDLHGHVVDIMYVLLALAASYALFLKKSNAKSTIILISFVLSLMYMTNAWDGVIYMLFLFLLLAFGDLNNLKSQSKFSKFNLVGLILRQEFLAEFLKKILAVIFLFILFTLPFNFFFKPFASGIGVLCAPNFLTQIGKVGPFLFEPNHCQKSAWWELLMLYGFFYFFALSFILFIFKKLKNQKVEKQDFFILIMIFISSLLIIAPEVVYLKDIYPQHYRANTMFKLVYQAFIMLSLASSYIIVRIMDRTKNLLFYFLTVFLLALVFIYPYFAIKSYYGDLKTYSGLDGLKYLKTRYPSDYDAIIWINQNIKNRPVMVEAQGDSYTDYERVSANTGLPTILGWTVHEWLWRGTYNVPAPRINDVKEIYESPDMQLTRSLLRKYNAQYVYVGNLEHQKYPNLIESKFKTLGVVIYQKGETTIYKLSI